MASSADLSHLGIQPEFAALQVDSSPAELPGIPKETKCWTANQQTSRIDATTRWRSGNDSACQCGDAGLVSGLGRSLEQETAARSSALAWKIPWTEEPGGLQSMGARRVGHD